MIGVLFLTMVSDFIGLEFEAIKPTVTKLACTTVKGPAHSEEPAPYSEPELCQIGGAGDKIRSAAYPAALRIV
jgi:hypothetical protein